MTILERKQRKLKNIMITGIAGVMVGSVLMICLFKSGLMPIVALLWVVWTLFYGAVFSMFYIDLVYTEADLSKRKRKRSGRR